MTADALHGKTCFIYGTGFMRTASLMPMKTGTRGGDLHETWDGDPARLTALTTPGFPNLRRSTGRTPISSSTVRSFFFSECSVRYIVNPKKMMGEKDVDMMEVRQDVHDEFNVRVDANLKMAWARRTNFGTRTKGPRDRIGHSR